MEASNSNPLISAQKSSQLQAVLHPLVLLTISDYITRHTLREQGGPIIGALLGQQNGREITVEHAFECHVREAPEVEGGYLLDNDKFSARLEQMVTVHKDRQLELVGWYTLLPNDGPTTTILPIHDQILATWNESAVLLGFHPQQVLDHSVGGKLPLTIYESNYEVDERTDQDGEDKKMDDGESALKLRFREVPYSVETDETEMISMNYVAGGGGSAAAATAKDERPARSIETNSKGKRRLIESELDGVPREGSEDDAPTLSKEEDEMIATLTAKANAIKMLQARIRLLTTYLKHLPPSYTSGNAAEEGAMDTDHTVPSLTVLRQIKALVGRLDLVIPSDSEAFKNEILAEENNVNLVGLLTAIVKSTDQARDTGKKFHVIETARHNTNKRHGGADFGAVSSFLSSSGDMLM